MNKSKEEILNKNGVPCTKYTADILSAMEEYASQFTAGNAMSGRLYSRTELTRIAKDVAECCFGNPDKFGRQTKPEWIKWFNETFPEKPLPSQPNVGSDEEIVYVPVSVELVNAYEDYIKLLGEEISDLMGLAMVHGIFETSRVKAGEQCRKTISELKAVSKPVSDEDVQAIAKEKYSREDYSNFQQGKIIGFQDGYKAALSNKSGARWVKASERLPDENWKGKMRNITIDGSWNYENNVPYKMIKGLLKHELNLHHEWLDESPMQLGEAEILPEEITNKTTPEQIAKAIIDNPNLWGMYSIADAIHRLIKFASITEAERLKGLLKKLYIKHETTYSMTEKRIEECWQTFCTENNLK